MEIDTHFLRQLNVLDYSLLLAHQPLHQDERPRGSFGSLIIRAKRYARRPRRGSPPTALRYLKLILKASDRIGCLIAPRLSLEHIVCCYSYCFFCGQSVSLANASERYLSI
jgi:hypothetical protein